MLFLIHHKEGRHNIKFQNDALTEMLIYVYHPHFIVAYEF